MCVCGVRHGVQHGAPYNGHAGSVYGVAFMYRRKCREKHSEESAGEGKEVSAAYAL